MSNAPRCLVIGPSWVGDMVMAQSLFMALRARDPDCLIDVLAPGWSGPILQRMPEVHAALDMPLGHGRFGLGERRRIGKLLAGRYDQAIVLPNSWKSALIPYFASIPQRTGWRGEMRYGLLNDLRVLDEQRLPLMVQRFVALAGDKNAETSARIPLPRLSVQHESRMQTLHHFALLANESPVLGLCPGAEFGEAKRWPAPHYAAVADHWIANGGQVWLFGSAKDQDVAREISALLPAQRQDSVQILAGRTSLAEAVDLLSCCNAVVSNDSGLMHIAAALRRPLVVVYGSTSPRFTPPLAEKVEVLSLNLECSPCFERSCPLGHSDCLFKLPPTKVIAALERLLTPAAAADNAPDNVTAGTV